MKETLSDTICRVTGSQDVELGAEIQILWSGYGVIQRARLIGHEAEQVVIKHVDLSRARSNRRGWGGDVAHKRKVKSYQVETRFYEAYSQRCEPSCRVPKLIASEEKPDQSGWVLVLEDLDEAGFALRKDYLSEAGLRACLRWLASFHATFLYEPADRLWEIGTYWHLDTRPDELDAMPAGELKTAASRIDERLNAAEFQTLVHGDAKVANFCFPTKDGDPVAAVDFQYVGRGCGMKDVAYFISSCMTEQEAATNEDAILDFYFESLGNELRRMEKEVDFRALELEWRRLYPFAWADFCRFLAGWSPGHWKLNEYSKQMTQEVLAELSRE